MKNNVYTCIEIGSYEIKLLVCNLREERLFVLAQKCIESVGIERGQITNFDKLVDQIKKIKELVELDLKQPLENLILNVPPIDAIVEHMIGKINLDVKQPVNSADVRTLFRQVMEQPHVETHLPVGLIPRLFKIDESHVVQNPRGLSGMSLGIEAQRILMPTTTVANLVHVVEGAGFTVDEIIVGSIAETLLTLTTSEMYARACHINIGHKMTTLTVINDGRIIHARALSFGGRDITRALSEKFNISEKIADQLKIRYGKIVPHTNETPDNQVIYVDDCNSNKEIKFITRGMLNEVITDWSEKLFKVIKTHIVDELRLREQEYHYSLAGGTAELPNLLYSLQTQLPMPAKAHRPTMLGIRDSKFSSLVGIAIFAHELTLLLGSNLNEQSLDFDLGLEKVPITEMKAEAETAVASEVENSEIEKVLPASESEKLENTQPLKDAIAGVSRINSEESKVADHEGAKVIPVYGEFDDIAFSQNVASEIADEYVAETYTNQKLENSGVLVRFFGKILNENEETE